jgi:hypothetical protein
MAMTFEKDILVALAFVVAAGAGAFVVSGCEDESGGPTPPKVEYKDQTFALLVCDGNGNDPASWDHDGAAACTLDWNGDASGPNRVPVTYAYDGYPLVDGVAENLSGKVSKGGDYWLWQTTPWSAIKTRPMSGKGSGVKDVWVKALYTYVHPPRIWFFFRWEDPSHTMLPTTDKPYGGTHQYYWLQKGVGESAGEGFKDNRQWNSHEDWLALVWSTWFVWNTENKGKADKGQHKAADLNGRDWRFVETVPGFQEKGIDICRGTGDVAYKTPKVYTADANSPYYDKYYPGAYCDLWFFSATRSNYNGRGWEGSAWLFDCYIDSGGLKKPPPGSNSNPRALDENLTFDAGTPGYEANGGVNGYPAYCSRDDPSDNPPGPPYLWKPSAAPFDPRGQWPKDAGFRIPGYLHRPTFGSVADVVCRCQWQQPDREYYPPWEGAEGQRLKKNFYGKDWYYTLEVMREIGALTKIDPEEDALLGLFDPHPGK